MIRIAWLGQRLKQMLHGGRRAPSKRVVSVTGTALMAIGQPCIVVAAAPIDEICFAAPRAEQAASCLPRPSIMSAKSKGLSCRGGCYHPPDSGHATRLDVHPTAYPRGEPPSQPVRSPPANMPSVFLLGASQSGLYRRYDREG
jgi:hypothetical protein